MITIASHLWRSNKHSFSFSTMYTPEWADKLYRGFSRNLTVPWRMICWTDEEYEFSEPIEQRRLLASEPDYSSCLQPYELNEPMILVGLDTVITGNCDALAEYALSATTIALPRDPNRPYTSCNGACLVPAGKQSIWTDHNGENDMAWMRRQPHEFIDDLFPGQVVSYKGGVHPGARDAGIGDARIIYLHGEQKMHQFEPDNPLLAHWI